ncbi:hypothetical protein E2I00_012892, partial [Balaenoptera physalus]
STLPLKQEEYEAFLLKLVQNLFAEGNDLFREKEYKQALVQYVEGLNVADYAASDQVALPRELLCKLHGLYEKALEDSEKALGLDGDNIRALFRKARALTELGRHKEAYACSSRCSLALPHDESVTHLGQELAQKLGLRVRKAYKRPQGTSNGLGSIDDIETGSVPDMRGRGGDGPWGELSPSLPRPREVRWVKHLPSPALQTGLLGPRCPGDYLKGGESGGLPGSGVPSELPQLIPVFPGGTPLLPPVVGGSIPVSSPLPPASFGLVMDPSKKLAASVLDALDPPGSALDSLDLLPYSETRLDTLDSFGSTRGSLDKPSSFMEEANSQDHRPLSGTQKPAPSCPPTSGAQAGSGGTGHRPAPKMANLPLSQPEPSMPNTALLIKNPLAATHEFKQACQLCYPKTGRATTPTDQTWKRIRPRPTKTSFVGSYYLCKDMINKQDCKYGDNCTFAYHQEEIDVWTEERKGTLNRDLLFDPLGGVKRGSLTIAKLLKEHQGIFTFLCEDQLWSIELGNLREMPPSPSLAAGRGQERGTQLRPKPELPERRTPTSSLLCQQCLVHIVRSTSLKYSKVRQFQEHFQFDVCRHEGLEQERVGALVCVREGKADSLTGRDAVSAPPSPGMTHEDIVQESKKYWQQMEAHAGKASSSLGAPRTHGPSTFDLQMKFVCGQCWRNGQVVEPDKDLNPEERDMWTFMKENKILDMQQTYDMWLKKHNPGKPGEGTPISSREGEKQIQMPTDYADIMMGYHCWLCGKNSNSKKQWQQHIQSEKHKEKKLAKARKDMLLCPRDDDFGKYNFLLQEDGNATGAAPEAPAAATITGE